MRMELTRIGNSRGIRIPKPLIAQCGLGKVVELRITPDGLIIAPHRTPREGWREAFAADPSAEREMVLESVRPNLFDTEEWKW
jgi:antitoxin MazE